MVQDRQAMDREEPNPMEEPNRMTGSQPYTGSSGTNISTDNVSLLESLDRPKVLEEEVIRLLAERVVVDRSKRKVGEVIVRKEIETRMVQVPVRREKLIVEQVSPEHKQLEEIELGQESTAGFELNETAMSATNLDSKLTVRGEFDSPKVSSLLLNALSMERRHGCKKVRVKIVVEIGRAHV